MTWVRVKDKTTGYRYSVTERAFDPEAHQKLKQPAADRAGRPLPPEYDVSSSSKSGQSAATTKEGK